MPYIFPKHPNNMNPQELFDIFQQVQKHVKSQGQHYPLYTKTQPDPGTQAGVEHMHEEATRQQLVAFYEAQKQDTPCRSPTSCWPAGGWKP